MRVAVCAIRQELENLPPPVVARHVYHEAWTEYKFAAGRFYHRPVHQLILTDNARAFVLSHSRTELIAALAPLLLDPGTGGRAAAVLAGLPARSRSALRNTSALAKAVQSAQGGDPDAPIIWVPAKMGRFYQSQVPTALYGLTNMGMRLERSVPRNYRGSFEARLEQVLLARGDLPGLVIAQGNERKAGPRQTVAQMLGDGSPPEADARFLKYLTDFSREDILISIFPWLGAGGQGTLLVDIIWLNGDEERLWPLVIGQPLIEDDPYKPIHEALAKELINLCNN